MANIIQLSGYESLKNRLTTFSGQVVNIYFTGSKDVTGVSWCPDCVRAEPHLLTAVRSVKDDSVLVIVDVGDRAYWKDMKNPFRLDKDFRLQVIPSLVRWGSTSIRLEGDQCEKPELLEMFFNENE